MVRLSNYTLAMQIDRSRFGDLFTIEAWHFQNDDGAFDLIVNASFSKADIGGEPGTKVRFKLSLKKAVVDIQMPNERSFRVVPTSVDRENVVFYKVEELVETEGELSAGAKLAGKLKDILSLSARIHKSRKDKIEKTGQVPEIRSKHGLDNKVHKWTLEPFTKKYLSGRVWEQDKKRLSFKDLRTNEEHENDEKTNNHPPVFVRLRCHKEDLDPTSITLTDELEEQVARGRAGHEKRLRAAEALIRECLIDMRSPGAEYSADRIEIILAAVASEAVG